MIPQPRSSRGIDPRILQAMLIVVAGFWVYSPVFHGGWLWDDNFLITDNPLKDDPNGLWRIWSEPAVLYDYYPITFTVQRLQWWLWGGDTLGYHLTNIILHITSALLIWRLFHKLGLQLAWWGGLLFAVHPVMVESVAWIAELKNTLSLPPFLLAMCYWIDYDQRRDSDNYRRSLVLFVIAILCKTTMFVLPVILLLYAWWKRGRVVWKDFAVTLPFLVVAMVFVGVQIAHPHDISDSFPSHLFTRLALVGSSLAFYLGISFWPVALAPIYPQWTIDPPSAWQFAIYPLLAALVAFFWANRKSWGRHALLGLGFFLITLLPFAGLKPAPTMIYTWVMDHFLYIPIIGLVGLVVAGLEGLDQILAKSSRSVAMVAAAMATALLGWQAHAYAANFRDSTALWTYAVQQNPRSWFTHASLGDAYVNSGRIPDAIEQLNESLAINPTFISAHYNLGTAFTRLVRFPEAVAQYEQVYQADPKFANVTYLLAADLISAKRIPEATDLLERLLQQNPQHTAAHVALGNIFMQEGRIDEATEQFAQAAALDGSDASLHYVLGNALLKANKLPEALAEYQQAAQISPRDLDILGDLGVIYARMGRINDAAQQFELMLQIDPKSPAAHTNMGSLLLTVGKTPEAIAQYQEALRLAPNFTAAQQALARAQAMQQSGPAAR